MTSGLSGELRAVKRTGWPQAHMPVWAVIGNVISGRLSPRLPQTSGRWSRKLGKVNYLRDQEKEINEEVPLEGGAGGP